MEEEKTIVMPLVTSSENGFFLDKLNPHWESLGRCGVVRANVLGLILSLFNYSWNTVTVEGDSPVDFGVLWFCLFLE